jgi:hypothetical protein
MAKSFAKNKLLGIIAFFSAVCMPFNTNTGEGFMKKALAYEPHEVVFMRGLNFRFTNDDRTNQQMADNTCRANFQELREQGIFDESVQRNQWHIWAHVQDGNCVMNINTSNLLKVDQLNDWSPRNNRDKRFTITIPRFR